MEINRGFGPSRDRSLEMQLSHLRQRVAEIDRLIQGIVENDATCSSESTLLLLTGISDRRDSQSSFAQPHCARSRRIR
jgi:hypothetical protein